MDVLVRLLGAWGEGDLLCAEPMLRGLREHHGPAARIWLAGRPGNLAFSPEVSGPAPVDLRPDRTVEVRLFTHLPVADYARLEAKSSLIDHMCSYAGVAPADRRPRLHLQTRDLEFLQELRLPRRPRIAICADHVDPLRHWPVERWHRVAQALTDAGASVVGVGLQDRLPVGTDLVGRLTLRQTAALLTRCDLFLGNNSGLFHYAQAAGLPCVTLFSVAQPARFVHPGAVVHPVQADHLPCLHCMTRCFASMVQSGCIAAPRGRCMLEIPEHAVLAAAAETLDRVLADRRCLLPRPERATAPV